MNDEHGDGSREGRALSREARALIAIGREGDAPNTVDRARVRAKLLAGIAGTATAVAAAKTSAAAQLGSGASVASSGASVTGTGAGGLLSAKLGAGVLAVALATAGVGAVVLHVAQRTPAAERSNAAPAAPVEHTRAAQPERAVEPTRLAGARPAGAPLGTSPTGETAPSVAAEPIAAPAALENPPAAARKSDADRESALIAQPQLDAQLDAVQPAQPAETAGSAPSKRPADRPRARRSVSRPAARTSVRSASGVPASSSVAPSPAAASPAAVATRADADLAPSLRRELTLIAAAQAALARNAPEEALRWLDAHAAGYASGELVQERLAARAVALCALGRGSEGRRVVGELTRLAPHSPLLGRARRACAGDKP